MSLPAAAAAGLSEFPPLCMESSLSWRAWLEDLSSSITFSLERSWKTGKWKWKNVSTDWIQTPNAYLKKNYISKRAAKKLNFF